MSKRTAAAVAAITIALLMNGPSIAAPISSRGPIVATSELKTFVDRYLQSQLPRKFWQSPTKIAVARLDARHLAVYVLGNSWCGTGGCHLLLLRKTPGSYAVLGFLSIVHLPIRVLDTATSGEPDIGVMVGGGGIRTPYEAVLRFDGTSYPSNPTVPPAQPVRDGKGTIVLSYPAVYQSLP